MQPENIALRYGLFGDPVPDGACGHLEITRNLGFRVVLQRGVEVMGRLIDIRPCGENSGHGVFCLWERMRKLRRFLSQSNNFQPLHEGVRRSLSDA